MGFPNGTTKISLPHIGLSLLLPIEVRKGISNNIFVLIDILVYLCEPKALLLFKDNMLR